MPKGLDLLSSKEIKHPIEDGLAGPHSNGYRVEEVLEPAQVVGEGFGGALFRKFLENLCHQNFCILDRSPHVLQSVSGGGLEDGAINKLMQLFNEVLGLVDVNADEVVGDPDLGVE